MPELIIKDSVSFGPNGGQNATGTIAKRLLDAGMNVNSLRTNGTLREREWIQYDTAIIQVARKVLVATQDLMSRGLVYNLPNALAKTRLEWEKVSDMEAAEVSMSGISQSENDRVVFGLDSMPIPIVHKDFNINIRPLMASRVTGESLDVTQARYAARKVAEQIETMIFNGATVLGANQPIYGLTTAPYRNTGTLTESWLTATPDTIVSDVLAMIAALIADNQYGPYLLYIPRDWATRLGEDYKTYGSQTIMQRLAAIEGISAIRASADLTGRVILVQESNETIEIVNGMSPTTVEWDTAAGMIMNFKVMAIMVPRVRQDFINQSGIADYVSP